MSELERDLEELKDAVITKKDIKAALELLTEVIGAASVGYLGFILLTSWLPGIGIPVATGVAVKTLHQLMGCYSELPKDQRRAVALIVRKLHTLGIY